MTKETCDNLKVGLTKEKLHTRASRRNHSETKRRVSLKVNLSSFFLDQAEPIA